MILNNVGLDLSRVAAVIYAIIVNIGSTTAQQKLWNVSGYVYDIDGNPIENASVTVSNVHLGTSTDEMGFFNISDIVLDSIIVKVSALGYQHETQTVHKRNVVESNITFVCKKNEIALQQVTITADKRERLLQNTPSAVSVIQSEDVEKFRLWNLADLGSVAPNVHIQMTGSDMHSFSIRGIVPPGGASFDQPVAVYLDGILQYDIANTMALLYNIERIEVLRGPQGTLYGRNAMAGVINIITKKPNLDQGSLGFAEASIGDFGAQRYVVGTSIPLYKDLSANIAGFVNKSDGYYTNVYDGNRFDKNHHVGGSATIRYMPSSAWDVNINFKIQHSENHGTFPFILYDPQKTIYRHVTNQDTSGNEVRDLWNVSLSMKNHNRWFNIHSITAYQYSNRFIKDGRWDFDWTPRDINSSVYVDSPNDNASGTLTQELRFDNNNLGMPNLYWTVGSFLHYHQRKEIGVIHVGEDAVFDGDSYAPYQLRTPSQFYNAGIAVFGQMSYTILPKLEITAGLRYDWENKLMYTQTDMIKEGTPDTEIQQRIRIPGKYTAFTHKVNLSFKPMDAIMFYGTYSTGFRAGGLNNRTSIPAFLTYDPEFSTNWELGLKLNGLANKFSASFAAFHIDWRDMQVAMFLPGSTFDVALQNAGRAVSSGLELEVSALLAKDLELDYAFGFTTGRYKKMATPDPTKGDEIDLSGNRLISQPDFTSMLVAQYSYPIAPKIIGTARLEWNHIGFQSFDIANSISQRSYPLFNVRLQANYQQIGIAFWMKNIFNHRYISSIYASGSPFVVLGAPGNYGLTLSLRFQNR